MKKIFSIILSVFFILNVIHSQTVIDTLYTLDGKSLPGEYIKVNPKMVHFILKGNNNESIIPKDKISKIGDIIKDPDRAKDLDPDTLKDLLIETNHNQIPESSSLGMGFRIIMK